MAKRVLIVSAHPDDEVIGMGGTMLKHKAAGDALHWLIMTRATKPRWSESYIAQKEREIAAVAKFFGARGPYFGGFAAVALNAVPTADLADAVSRAIAKIKPETVYCPPPNDINNDHALVFEASRVAVRALPGQSVRELIAYEIAPTTRFCDPQSYFVPNCYVDISRYIRPKLQAFKLYKTELRTFPHPRSVRGLEIAARERGLAIGATHAEAFTIIRSSR